MFELTPTLPNFDFGRILWEFGQIIIKYTFLEAT